MEISTKENLQIRTRDATKCHQRSLKKEPTVTIVTKSAPSSVEKLKISLGQKITSVTVLTRCLV